MKQQTAPSQRLGARSPHRLPLTTAAVTAFTLVSFAVLASLVATHWMPLLAADASADGAAHGWVLRHRAVVGMANILAFAADDPAMYAVTGVAIAGCVLRHQLKAAFYLAVAKLIQVVAEPVAKDVIGRPRPTLPDPVAIETGFSFPSGHATRAATLVVGLVVLWLVTTRSPRPAPMPATVSVVAVVSAAVVVVAAVAASRVLLGVHYPSDVVAGALLGTACACAAAPLLNIRRAVAS